MSKTKAKRATALAVKQQTTLQLQAVVDDVHGALAHLADIITTTDSPGTLAAIHTTLNRDWTKVIEDQKKVIREMLLTLLEEEGSVDGLNRYATAEYDGTRFELKKQVARSKLPDEAKLAELLESKRCSPRLCMREVITYEVDMDRVEDLIRKGKLTEAEVDACRKVTSTQLKVEKL